MKYKITIERKEKNLNFEAELKQWENKNQYSNFKNEAYPVAENITDALICELTEEQFKAIKAQVFKVFE